MLLIPTLFIVLTIAVAPIRHFMIRYIVINYVCMVIIVIMLLSLLCFHYILKEAPQNYLYLAIFTVLESYTLATLTCFSRPEYALFAAILATAMGFCLSCYSCLSSIDFTTIVEPLCWVSMGISIVALFLLAVLRDHVLVIVPCWIFFIIVSLYIIVDTQHIIEGKYSQLGLDDYVIASMMLFIDYVSIFVYCLLYTSPSPRDS